MGPDVTSVLSDAQDFQAALSMIDDVSLLFTGRASFRARVTHVALQNLGLFAVEESLARIACIKVPDDRMLTSFLVSRQASQTWGGLPVNVGDVVAAGPGTKLFVRTQGPCHWSIISCPVGLFTRFHGAIIGRSALPATGLGVWRPSRSRIGRLRHFHTAAIRMAHGKWEILAEADAARGLEQELIYALVECMTEAPSCAQTANVSRHQSLVTRFHQYLQRGNESISGLAECCAALGVSRHRLQIACQQQLGMQPDDYLHLRLNHTRPNREGAMAVELAEC